MQFVRSADGTPIAFEKLGTGPPLIIVGGALSDRAAAVPLATLLADRFTVIAYDRRGRGDSGDSPPYAVERELEDLAALIAEAGGSTFLSGHSSGGVLALEAARTLVPAVRMLAVYEPPFIVEDSRRPMPPDYVARVDELVAADRRGDAVAYFLTVGPEFPPEEVARIRGTPRWLGMEALAHTIAYDGRVVSDTVGGSPAPLQRWASVGVPTLVLDGGASAPWQRSATQALARVLPRAVHRSLPGQTHGVDPEILAPVLRAFLEDEPLP
ncbi:MAG TPA: alpha/beta hydrolase [Actinomycetota bacterium]|nr:alpha/beta hydrolase [Actinomycetota bacterium]